MAATCRLRHLGRPGGDPAGPPAGASGSPALRRPPAGRRRPREGDGLPGHLQTKRVGVVGALHRNAKFKRVRSLPAGSIGVALCGQKPGPTAFRVRALVGRDIAEYSAVVEITVP
jgi:hypothetical protein